MGVVKDKYRRKDSFVQDFSLRIGFQLSYDLFTFLQKTAETAENLFHASEENEVICAVENLIGYLLMLQKTKTPDREICNLVIADIKSQGLFRMTFVS